MNSETRIPKKINKTHPENLKKVSCSGNKVEDKEVCILKRVSRRKVRLNKPEKMEVKRKVTMGKIDKVKDLVIIATGSKNQII